LALAHVARTANLLHLSGYMKASLGRRLNRAQIHHNRTGADGLLDLQGPVATPAKAVGCLELGEPAIGKCAAHNFARLHAVWGGRHHGWCAERQSRASAMLLSTTIFATINEMNHNCQVKSWVRTKLSPIIPLESPKKPEKKRTKLCNIKKGEK
jgi:hypothetical protein